MGGAAAVAASIHVYAVPFELSGLVESIWTFSAGPGRYGRLIDYIEPDIGAELIWQLGDQPKLFLRGPQRGFSTIALKAPSIYLGARLLPGAATRLFGVAPATIRDNRIPVRIVDPATRAQPEPVHRRDTPLCEARAGFAALLANAWRTSRTPTLARRAAQLIEAAHGSVTVEELAGRMRCSTRHLHRSMVAEIGIAPKAAARIARFRRAARLIRGGQPLAGVALEAGYGDQAHLTRDFAALGAPSPKRLRALSMSDNDKTIRDHARYGSFVIAEEPLP
jgi:AraC-like DNA-binding protein